MRNIFLLLLFISILSSCEKNENDDNDHELDGIWYLKSVTCLCPPSNFQGDHIWNFDTDNFNVTVINNPDEDLQILNSGTYAYSISATKIVIDSVAYDYFFQNKKLILAHMPELDGPYMEFER